VGRIGSRNGSPLDPRWVNPRYDGGGARIRRFWQRMEVGTELAVFTGRLKAKRQQSITVKSRTPPRPLTTATPGGATYDAGC